MAEMLFCGGKLHWVQNLILDVDFINLNVGFISLNVNFRNLNVGSEFPWSAEGDSPREGVYISEKY